MTTFNRESSTFDVTEGVSLAGKLAFVTGASAGLGIETSRALAAAGAKVVMLGRNPDKLEAAAQGLREAVPEAHFDTLLLDLADLESVRKASAEAVARYPVIDILVNNAGVMACPMERTAQGFEMQFGTNHLGHFLFSNRVMPALKAAAQASGSARVVSLSSAGHKFAAFDFEDPNFEHTNYDKWVAYGRSKTANALFAVGLDQRVAGAGVRALAVHPGVIMTELSRHMDEADFELLSSRAPAGEPLRFKTVEQGAATSVWAATAPALAGRGGLYLEDCQVAQPAVAGGDGGVEAYAVDPELADKLWQLSESLVGERFSKR